MTNKPRSQASNEHLPPSRRLSVLILYFLHCKLALSDSEWIVSGLTVRQIGQDHRMPTPPPSFTRRKADRNHLNEEIIPLLPTGLGERFSQTISNLGHADVNSPNKRKC
jgi:hypothetical protein